MFDPKPLIDVDSVENVRCLMRIASQVRALALRPWMRTVAAGLEKPLIAIDAVAGEGSREKWPAYLAEVGSPRRASGQVIGSPPEQHYCYRFVAIYDTATD